MKLRTYTYVNRNSLLQSVELPDADVPQIHDDILELCDAVVYFDEPAPGLVRATPIKAPYGLKAEAVVGEAPDPFEGVE